MVAKRKTGKKQPIKLYTRGQLNYLIDDVVHPFFDKHVGFVLVDEILHAVVEKNPRVVTKKFLRYSLPEIIKKIAEDL
jgi:hypothetical protein